MRQLYKKSFTKNIFKLIWESRNIEEHLVFLFFLSSLMNNPGQTLPENYSRRIPPGEFPPNVFFQIYTRIKPYSVIRW